MIKTVNIIIPVFNEEQNIKPFFFELKKVTQNLKKYKFKYVFVDDGSTDRTVNEIKKLNNEDIIFIELVRNFGKESALTAGLKESPESDYYLTIDSDLQHPPEIIKEILKMIEINNDIKIVECVRKENKDYNFLRQIFNYFFYYLIKILTNSNSFSNTTDYRLYDREVVKQFSDLKEKNRTVRFLIDWIGFKKKKIYFNAPQRTYGKSKYKLRSLMRMFIKVFTSFSTVPLKIILIFGTFVTVGFFLLLIYMIIINFFENNIMFSNISFVIVLGVILLGIILIAIGFLGLYISNIHDEVLNRPIYIKKKN